MFTRLLSPAKVGSWTLSNHIVMAPLTRSRAEVDWTPSRYAPEYYGQRSSAGMVICEATQVSPDATGYCRTPGIWSASHTDQWKAIVDEIHAGGAIAVLQLWHCGRIGHPDNMPPDCFPMAPSPVQPKTPMYTDVAGGDVANPVPRQMTEDDIQHVITAYGNASRNAKAAGFDGVEIHGANGYLVEQFAASNTNLRDDAWGGTRQKRMRFLREVIDSMAKVYERAKIGLRLSPFGTFNEIADEKPMAMFEAMLHTADEAKIGYVHIIRPRVSGDEDRTASQADTDVVAAARQHFSGTVIAAGGFTPETAEAELNSGRADLITFGRPFIANPDFVRRIRENRELSPFNPQLLYTPGPEGYIDYRTAT